MPRIYYCTKLGIVEIPLIKRLSDKIDDNFEMITWRNYITTIIGVVAGAILFSVILFKLTSPQLSETMKQLSEGQGTRLGISSKPTVLTALVVIAFAFGEEILFRLGIQNYLAHQFRLNGDKYWIAVVLTSGLWALAHANILTPEWVKIVQIFPIRNSIRVCFQKIWLRELYTCTWNFQSEYDVDRSISHHLMRVESIGQKLERKSEGFARSSLRVRR